MNFLTVHLSLDFCQRGQNFLRRIPQSVIALPQFVQISVIEPARLMDAAGELVEVITGAPQQGNHLPQLRQFQVYHKAVNRHLAELRRHVGGAELGHLLFDQRPFLRRDAEF